MFPQIFGKYVLERELAAGGMARVYLATLRGAVGFEKRLVVKQIRAELASDEAFVRRFVEEAKTTVELGHPNIVPVYELGVEQGVYYIAMELCEGATLAELLTDTGPLGPEEGAYIGVEICRALDYAHRRAGIVHRDVTPRNVLVDEEGAVRLIDFGIAAPATLEGDSGRRAEVFGSPGHMPPEQLRGERLTAATDVFAVGALLIEAWTGKPPFRRSTAAESERALETPAPSVARDEPRLEALARLIGSSVSLEPRERPESAEILARPLREFLKSTDLGDIARRLGERVRRSQRRAQTSSPWLIGEGMSSRHGTPRTPIGATPRANGRTPGAGAAEASAEDGGVAAIVTRTFAAREDIVEWTRKLPSVPPSADSGTPESAGGKRAAKASASTRPPPVVSTQRSASVPPSSLSGARSEPAPARSSVLETGSRRRSEDDTLQTTSSGAMVDSERSASRWRLIAAMLAGVVIAALVSVLYVGRTASLPAPAPRPSEPKSAVLTPPTPQSVARPIEHPALPEATSLSSVASTEASVPRGTVPPEGRSTAVRQAADAGAKRDVCSVILRADVVGTSATIAGRPAPLGSEIRLPCGKHSGRVTSAELGEFVPFAVTLEPGRTVRGLASFRGESPIFIVQ